MTSERWFCSDQCERAHPFTPGLPVIKRQVMREPRTPLERDMQAIHGDAWYDELKKIRKKNKQIDRELMTIGPRGFKKRSEL